MRGKLKYIILEAPYENSELAAVQDHFPKIIQLKKSGYSSSYPLGALPLDTTDFIGTHHCLLIEETEGRWQIALGYKTISLSRCDLYGLKFPALSLTENSNAPRQAKYVRDLISSCREKNMNLTYGGSWTSEPSYRKDRELNATLREIMSAMLVAYHRHENFQHQVCLGVPRFQTDAYFGKIGYLPIEVGENPEFPLCSLQGEPVKLLHSAQDTEFGQSLFKKYFSFWQEREVIGINPEDTKSNPKREAA